jgi:RNA polymerase sigma-70 factor (ECF subfamily)
MSIKTPRITPAEIETIKDAKAGSMKAFNRIFYRYKSFVEQILYQYLGDMDEARDLTNDVFLKVYEKLSLFTRYDSFGGWLRILAKNTAIDYLRVHKSFDVSTDDERLQLRDVSGDDEVSVTNKLTYDYLIKLFDKIPPSYRESCKLYYIDNLKVADIAKIQDIPVNTVKSNLFRMRKLLKKLKL